MSSSIKDMFTTRMLLDLANIVVVLAIGNLNSCVSEIEYKSIK